MFIYFHGFSIVLDGISSLMRLSKSLKQGAKGFGAITWEMVRFSIWDD